MDYTIEQDQSLVIDYPVSNTHIPTTKQEEFPLQYLSYSYLILTCSLGGKRCSMFESVTTDNTHVLTSSRESSEST